MIVAIVGATTYCVTARADILFADNFNRPDTGPTTPGTGVAIDNSLVGITNNTGSPLTANGGVYGQGHVDPAYPANAPDGNATNGGGQRILINELQVKYGTGTANVYVKHNFINPEILAADGFSVSLDIKGGASTGPGFGAGFGIGMSLAEADGTGDALGGATKMQDGFQDAGQNTEASVAVSDFWVVLRADTFLQFGSKGHSLPFNQPPPSGTNPGPAYLGGFDHTATTGTIRVDFYLDDFNNGSTVNFNAFIDNVQINSGSFIWTGTNENYIGIDARDGTAARVDNFSVSAIFAVPEASCFTAMGMITLGLGCLAINKRRRQLK